MAQFSTYPQGPSSIKTRLQDLILPNTDQDIIQAYESLAKRAKTTSFGLIEDELIFLDTETTGLDRQHCELIQVAALRVCQHEVVDEFCAFIKPTGELPAAISELTGITEADLQNASSADVVLTELAEFIAGDPVVAHNVEFDRYFLEKQSPVALTQYWVDSLSLARIALPRLSHHRLNLLVEAFGLDEDVSHNALDDARALAALWRILLCALYDLPAGLLLRLSHMHPKSDWSLRPIFSYLAQSRPDEVFSLKSERDQRLRFLQQRFSDRYKVNAQTKHGHEEAMYYAASFDDEDKFLEPDDEANREFTAASFALDQLISDEEIREEFGPDGLVGKMYEGYEERIEQSAMAVEVNRALYSQSYRAIEAGTGVGKSIAYLVPSMMFALKTHSTVGVATKTNALMDQLIYRELPLLQASLKDNYGENLRYCALKGYDHYPCLRKLERFMNRNTGEQLVSEEDLCMIATVMSFSCQSSEGDLDLINLPWSKLSKCEVTTTSSGCEKNKCPYFSQACFVHGPRKRAHLMDLVITNHALLFRNVASDFAMISPIHTWILDEAHAVEEEARKQWSLNYNYTDFISSIDMLGSEKTGVLARIETLAKREAGASLLSTCITKLLRSLTATRLAHVDFFEALNIMRRHVKSSQHYDYAELWLGPTVKSEDDWQDILKFAENLREALKESHRFLKDLIDVMSQEGFSTIASSELNMILSSWSDVLETLEYHFGDAHNNCVHSLLIDQNNHNHSLKVEFLNVGEIFAERFYPKVNSVVYTSATMTVNRDFSYFNHALGLDLLERGSCKTLQLSSSYDYDNHMSILVPEDLPEPNSPAYLDKMAEFLLSVHRGMQGSVLTLFTNRREMEYIYQQLSPILSAEGLTLACQKRGTRPKQLRELFINDPSSSLFALKSFWEGFDAQGDTLRCVVIPKLPFPTPNNPLSQQRRAQDQGSWFKYDLPESVISVKQAAGRLIRSSSDVGCLILADRRVLSKGYGKNFLCSLPKTDYTLIKSAEIERYLQFWHTSIR